jgi:hypothetical protein
MKFKDVMGTLSPVYGLMSGKGAFGALADSGLGGILPTMLAQNRKKKLDAKGKEVPMTPAEEAAAPAMKKGGSVKAKGSKTTRGDGICKKGHTKGRMV